MGSNPISSDFILRDFFLWGCSLVGRALALHARGHRFDSGRLQCILRCIKNKNNKMKIEIRLKSYEMSLLQRSKVFIENIFSIIENKDILNKKSVYFCPRETLFTILRSPHVHKKALDQYKLMKYKGFHSIIINNEKKAYEFINYLSKISFIGVQIHIQCTKQTSIKI